MKKKISVMLFLGGIFMLHFQSDAQQRIFNPNSSSSSRTSILKPYYGPQEELVQTFIRNNLMVTVNEDSASDMPREDGFVFTSSKKGLITGLGVNMPYISGTYTVSLWDYDTKQLLKQYPITVTAKGFGFAYVDMEAKSETVPIVANKKYVVSVFIKTNGLTKWPYYYLLQKGGNNTAVNFLPFTQGSLTLLNGQTTLTNTATFPDNVVYHMDILAGLCDVRFRATEK